MKIDADAKQETVLVTGAAGFIGSHLVDRLLERGHRVVGIDNLLLGRMSNLSAATQNPRFSFLEEDLLQRERCLEKLRALRVSRWDAIWHLAANSDIPAGVRDWSIDLNHTFLTTYHTLHVAKELNVPKFVFASSSAIYGDHPQALTESTGPLTPISNYGAMKLASEGCITAGVEAFLKQAWIYRFPNVVGGRSTHGVIHDFMGKLKKNPLQLDVLGDGTQQKPYLHVAELIDAMEFAYAASQQRVNIFNVANEDSGATVRHIAETVVRRVSPRAQVVFGHGNKGWVGDVPKFTYSCAKIRDLGWSPRQNSEQAIQRAVDEIARDFGF